MRDPSKQSSKTMDSTLIPTLEAIYSCHTTLHSRVTETADRVRNKHYPRGIERYAVNARIVFVISSV